jgi:HK97 family phage portal protein
MAFVVTAGQITAIQSAERVTAWGWTPSQAISLSPSLTMTYQQIWRSQPQLRTVVSFLARNVAQLGIDVFERRSGTDRVKMVDHPVARLLERPCPDTKWTKYRLINTLMHDLCIYDSAYLLKRRFPKEGTVGIYPISPTHIAPIGSEWNAAERYVIRGDKGEFYVDGDEVIHVYGYNPDDMRLGTSPIETLRQVLAEEHAATLYREQLWRNGARVAGYLKRPPGGKWMPESRERFIAGWQAQYTGDGPQAGGTPILEDGMEFVASGVSPKDAQYVESRKLTREEVAVAYHVSPSMVGMMEGTNFSSIQELHRMLYQDTLAPYLAQISQDLENQLLEDLDPQAKDGSRYIEFNLSEKLRGSFAEQASALQSAVGAPWMTRNEARGLSNLGDVDDGDELIVPLNVLEGGLASPNDTAPDNPSTEGNPKARELLRRTYKRQEKSTLCRIGAGEPDVFERSRWDAELAQDITDSGLAGGDDARWQAEQLNARTAARLIPALLDPNPKAAVRGVFDDLAREAS